MTISDNMMFVLLLKLGLNTGKDSSDRQGITIFSCDQVLLPHNKPWRYEVKGVHSIQDPNDTSKMIHTPFTVKL